MVVRFLRLERGVSQIAPQHGEHAELVCVPEHLGDFLNLPLRLLRAEIDRRADSHRAHLEGLPDAREPDLIEGVRVRKELVVIDLEQERNPVRVLPGDRTEHAQGRGHAVAATLDRQLHDVFRIEVHRIGRERSARGMLDALIDRENGHVSRSTEPSMAEQRLQAGQHARRSIGLRKDALDGIGTRQVEALLRNRLALMFEEARIRSQYLFNVTDAYGHGSPLPTDLLNGSRLQAVAFTTPYGP